MFCLYISYLTTSVAVQEFLKSSHDRARDEVLTRLHKEAFGKVDQDLEDRLAKALNKAWEELQHSNEVASNHICENLESKVGASECVQADTSVRSLRKLLFSMTVV